MLLNNRLLCWLLEHFGGEAGISLLSSGEDLSTWGSRCCSSSTPVHLPKPEGAVMTEHRLWLLFMLLFELTSFSWQINLKNKIAKPMTQ